MSAKIFSPEEMGVVIAEKFISLNNDFISEELGFCCSRSDYEILNKTLDVYCPFCKKGCLRLIKKDPIISYVRPLRRQIETAAEYEFDCSARCGARFSGKVELNIHVG